MAPGDDQHNLSIYDSVWSLHYISFFIFFSPSTGVWAQGLGLRGKHSTTWAMASAFFYFSYCSDRILTFCLGQPQMSSYLCLPVARTTGTTGQTGLLRWGLPNFSPSLTWIMILPISASQIAGITGVSLYAWLYLILLHPFCHVCPKAVRS
jgi:hypothetical protein